MSGWATIFLTREQMVTIGGLARNERKLVGPDHDIVGLENRWQIQLDPADGSLRLRDIERDYHIAPDGSQPWG